MAVSEYPVPSTKTGIRSFLGLAGYYQHYIPQCSEIVSPLKDALKKTKPEKVNWEQTKYRAFEALKEALMR